MRNKNTNGFTIVELLVVIVVIAILAGVVIVGYGAWRNDIATSSVKNDLTAALTSMDSARSFSEDGYPTSLPNTYTTSKGVTVTYKFGTAKGFCVEGVSESAAGSVYRIDTTAGEKEPVEGTCPPPAQTSTPIASMAGSIGYATTIDPATGTMYYSSLSGSSIYKLTASGQSSTLYATLGSGTIRDLVVHNGYLYAAADTVVKRVNLTNATVDSLTINGTLSGAQALYFDDSSSTLYIGARRDFYKVDLTTGDSQSLYYSGANPYFTGITKVGNKLYLTGMSYSLYTYDLTTNAMTSVSRPSGNLYGSLVYLGDRLYTTISGNLNSYDIATNTWTELQQVKTASCVPGGDIELYNQRLTYLGFTNLNDSTCVSPEHGWSIYSIKP